MLNCWKSQIIDALLEHTEGWLMQIKYPDYDNSILSIAASVLKHYGAECSHSSLLLLDELLVKNYKNVVVMVFDGMGTAILSRHLS